MSDKTITLLEAVLEESPTKLKEVFQEIMNEKAAASLVERRTALAESMMLEEEELEEEDEDTSAEEETVDEEAEELEDAEFEDDAEDEDDG